MIGATVGSYMLQRELGRGGMGCVYVGSHSLLGRTAAVKVLLPEFSRDQAMVQRFFNEARAATAIKHPGIVEVYDFGHAGADQDGVAYIVMEFLEGDSLGTRLRKLGKLTPAFAIAVARQMATALAVAHKAGIVHRDLKPDNVFLVPDAELAIGERVKLLDFGIAKLMGETTAGLQKTSTGTIMGTPYYMSPEQCRGAGDIDARSDLYALGCIIYEMIAGRVPFVAEGAGDIIAAHLLLPPAPLRNHVPDVPNAVEAFVMRLLAKSPDGRPASAEVCAQELAALGQALGDATSRPPSAPTIVAPQAKMDTLPHAALASAPKRSARIEAVTPAPRPRRTGLLLGLAAVAIAGAGAAAVMVTRDGDAATEVAAAKPTTRKPPPPRQPGEDIHLIAARTAIETRMWTEAIIEADAVLKAAPTSDEARELAALARSEHDALIASNTMAESLAAGDLVTANARFAAIPEDSVYKAPAMLELTTAREHHVLQRTPDVKGLIAKGKCKEAQALVTELETAAGTGPTEPLSRAVASCKPHR